MIRFPLTQSLHVGSPRWQRWACVIKTVSIHRKRGRLSFDEVCHIYRTLALLCPLQSARRLTGTAKRDAERFTYHAIAALPGCGLKPTGRPGQLSRAAALALVLDRRLTTVCLWYRAGRKRAN